MIYLKAHDLENVCFRILRAADVSEGHARIVSRHLAENNALGFHSHGVILLEEYIDRIRKGTLIPNAEPKLTNESGSTAVVDGCWTFGQVVASFATDLAIKKAQSAGISCVSMRNLTHLGRLGSYAERVAAAGLASIMFAADGGHGHHQVPFGGTKARLGTNPIAFSFPYQDDYPFLADFATSAVAAGKVLVCRARGQKLKEGWLIDADGKPTTDPEDYLRGGALLPLGGSEGHKGYALAFMCALFGSVLSQGGIPGAPSKAWSNTSLFIAIDVQKFAPLEKLKQDANTLVRFIKDTPLADASKPILYPGELEAQAHRKASQVRIGLEEATWDRVVSVLREYSIEDIVDSLDLSHEADPK